MSNNGKLRKTGVPEGTNQSYHNSVPQRFQAERPNVIKSNME